MVETFIFSEHRAEATWTEGPSDGEGFARDGAILEEGVEPLNTFCIALLHMRLDGPVVSARLWYCNEVEHGECRHAQKVEELRIQGACW